jgi:acetoin utilization deacetylase AcuC-like enzyme
MRIPVFYTPKMVAKFENYSPSAGKPKKVVDSWLKLGVSLDIIEPVPATVAEFCLVHDKEYVRQILACEIDNGFGNKLPEVAASLAHTTGSMLSAAREALKNGNVAVAPCSGFHHAGYANPQGFCTFNGLMVTAAVLLKEGVAKKVGVLDFDMHYGNGTTEIIKHLGIKDSIVHFSAGATYISERQAEDFLMKISKMVRLMENCDLILYQAGADPHIDDPLGGWLTTKQLKERDMLVFSVAKRIGVPVAWNLAGGYQQDEDGGIRPVLDIHDNTMRECAAIYR